jgi:alkylation response protein AidB-like acyl-CoA dehydrogenase
LSGAVSSPAETFRKELRSWLDQHLTPDVVAAGKHGVEANLGALRQWNRTLADARWAAPAWPSEHGGRDAGIDEQLAYFEEMHAAQAPGPVNVIGVSNIAPAIMAWGTDEQKQRYLRPMLRGDEIWSQGMSEPDAGSDLASLRTAAVRDGEHFVVNGQKIWNSLGHFADWCQLYVRTDPEAPKHKGITCFLVDLRAAGIEARPIRTMTGAETFAELFFTDARVPASAMLGPLNEGWRVAVTTLSHERAGVARLHLALRGRFDDLIADARDAGRLSDPVTRNELMAVYAEITCMKLMTDRSLAQMRAGKQPSSSLGSLAKLAWSHAEQRLANAAVATLGIAATEGPWATSLASARQTSIAGGTTEINKNIVAEQGLGLPRDR